MYKVIEEEYLTPKYFYRIKPTFLLNDFKLRFLIYDKDIKTTDTRRTTNEKNITPF